MPGSPARLRRTIRGALLPLVTLLLLFLLVVIAAEVLQRWRLRRHGFATTATITQKQQHGDESSGRLQLAWNDRNGVRQAHWLGGTRYQWRSVAEDDYRSLREGDQVAIVYDPGQPARVDLAKYVVEDYWWQAQVAALVMCTLSAGVCLALLRRGRQQMRTIAARKEPPAHGIPMWSVGRSTRTGAVEGQDAGGWRPGEHAVPAGPLGPTGPGSRSGTISSALDRRPAPTESNGRRHGDSAPVGAPVADDLDIPPQTSASVERSTVTQLDFPDFLSLANSAGIAIPPPGWPPSALELCLSPSPDVATLAAFVEAARALPAVIDAAAHDTGDRGVWVTLLTTAPAAALAALPQVMPQRLAHLPAGAGARLTVTLAESSAGPRPLSPAPSGPAATETAAAVEPARPTTADPLAAMEPIGPAESEHDTRPGSTGDTRSRAPGIPHAATGRSGPSAARPARARRFAWAPAVVLGAVLLSGGTVMGLRAAGQATGPGGAESPTPAPAPHAAAIVATQPPAPVQEPLPPPARVAAEEPPAPPPAPALVEEPLVPPTPASVEEPPPSPAPAAADSAGAPTAAPTPAPSPAPSPAAAAPTPVAYTLPAPPPPPTPPPFVWYRVRQGDTVYGIARLFGVRPHDIIRLNGLAGNGRIDPGQELLIPRGP